MATTKKAMADALSAYFTPGNVVPSYGGGYDLVIRYIPNYAPHFMGNVNVIGCDKDGVPLATERARWHGTAPKLKTRENSSL